MAWTGVGVQRSIFVGIALGEEREAGVGVAGGGGGGAVAVSMRADDDVVGVAFVVAGSYEYQLP